ncbi:MAG: pilus assembly protein [Acidobacteriota bacterium]|nr:pilus assembly protein [Acidobacteriota bacterium]
MLRRWRSEDGAQLVEFALVLPLLLLVVLGIAEFGIIFQRYEVVTNAAREGARIAVLPGYFTPDVEARVRTYVTQGRVPATLTNPNIVVANVLIPVAGGRPPINARRVTVRYTHNYLFLPGIGSWFGSIYTTVPMTAVAEMRNEAGS